MRGDVNAFINYRRADTEPWALVLYYRLAPIFDYVFLDVASDIRFGENFVHLIRWRLGDSDVVLVLIGPAWLAELHHRIAEHEEDHVRTELEDALQHARLQIIPVLCDNAAMPTVRDLPPSLRRLAHLNGPSLGTGRHAIHMLDELVDQLRIQVFRHRERLRPGAPVYPYWFVLLVGLPSLAAVMLLAAEVRRQLPWIVSLVLGGE